MEENLEKSGTMQSRILDHRFKYVSAAATDIRETWRKFGWRPRSEMPNMRGLDNSGTYQTEKWNSSQIQEMRK